MIQISINGRLHKLDIEPDTPLLWAIRDSAGLTGTKYGCGQSLCGACTVFLDGQPIRSCVTPVSVVGGRQVTTIEGIDSREAQAVKKAWEKLDVVQCGYCQGGQIMSATHLLKSKPEPTNAQINAAMSGNICRCHTYDRIRKGIKEAAAMLKSRADSKDSTKTGGTV